MPMIGEVVATDSGERAGSARTHGADESCMVCGFFMWAMTIEQITNFFLRDVAFVWKVLCCSWGIAWAGYVGWFQKKKKMGWSKQEELKVVVYMMKWWVLGHCLFHGHVMLEGFAVGGHVDFAVFSLQAWEGVDRGGRLLYTLRTIPWLSLWFGGVLHVMMCVRTVL